MKHHNIAYRVVALMLVVIGLYGEAAFAFSSILPLSFYVSPICRRVLAFLSDHPFGHSATSFSLSYLY